MTGANSSGQLKCTNKRGGKSRRSEAQNGLGQTRSFHFLFQVDDVQMNLIKYIILFSTSERLSLQRRDIVERVQMKFIDLLQKYLKFKYGPGEAGLRFSNGLMVISLAREVYEIQQRRLPV